MRSLILTVDPAAPPISGAELRNWQNAKALAALGSVLLLSVRPIVAPAPTAGGIECASLSGGNDASARKVNRRRSSVDLRISEAQLQSLSHHIEAFRPDSALVEGIPLFPFLAFLRPRVATLRLDMHNIESELRAEIDRQHVASRLRMALTGGDAASIRALEREALGIVDQVWLCSEIDHRRLNRLFAETAVAVVPNGIPRPETIPAALSPLAPRDHGWPVILFVGHLGYEPNIAAIRYLSDTLMPAIRGSFPDAQLVVAGRSPGEAITALAARHGFELLANPADLGFIYAKAHLSIVPLLAAGGTRLKILEALAYGVPVIATTLAAEGLDLDHGSEIVVADTAPAIAGKVEELFADPERLETMRLRGREAVLTRFGPAAVEAAVAEAVAAQAKRSP
jgi:glycosyltransferase involved in cell wall biosynthesis